jgi:TRAP-type C4-dicarboxylate transport system permease large subunit
MGVVIISTLVFGLITPPYGLSLLVASKFVGVPFYRAMFRSLAHRVYLMGKAHVGFSGTVEELNAQPEVRAQYLEV